jgi:hypothetical protein
MNYCLSINQKTKYLEEADEIKMKSKDWKYAEVVRTDYPSTPIIFEVDKDFELKNFLNFNLKNFIYACDNIDQMKLCKEYNVSFYYKYTITSYYEAEALKGLGVCYFQIGVPLIFDLKTIASFHVPLRAIANLAYEPYLPHKDGIAGSWIRPEDVDKYATYIDTLEFYGDPVRHEKEETLYKIYAKDKTWPGNLNLIIDHLNFDVDNRLIYDDGFAERRMNCKQKCVSEPGSCHYCLDRMKFQKHLSNFAKSQNGKSLI